MSIFIIIGLVLLFLVKRFISKIEYSTIEYEYYKPKELVWHDVKFPLWAWLLAALLLCVPILGIVLYIVGWILLASMFITDNTNFIRFKNGKSSSLINFSTKIIDFLNKKY